MWACCLNLPTSRTIADIVEAKDDPDEDFLNGVLAAHSSGIKVLVAPPRPEMAELVTSDHVRKILALLQKMFDYIVVDTGKGINDPLLAVFDLRRADYFDFDRGHQLRSRTPNSFLK